MWIVGVKHVLKCSGLHSINLYSILTLLMRSHIIPIKKEVRLTSERKRRF